MASTTSNAVVMSATKETDRQADVAAAVFASIIALGVWWIFSSGIRQGSLNRGFNPHVAALLPGLVSSTTGALVFAILRLVRARPAVTDATPGISGAEAVFAVIGGTFVLFGAVLGALAAGIGTGAPVSMWLVQGALGGALAGFVVSLPFGLAGAGLVALVRLLTRR